MERPSLTCCIQAFEPIETLTNLSSESRLIYKRYVESGLCCGYSNSFYLWNDGSGCWIPLCSPAAASQVLSAVGAYAPVNWAKAFEPYVSLMTRRVHTHVLVPESMCIWDTRYLIRDTEWPDMFRLEPAMGIVPVPEQANPRVSTFSVCSPYHYIHLGEYVDVSQTTRTEKFLRPLFSSDEEFDTFKWFLGNSLLDPGQAHKVMLLLGEGGTGKSTITDVVANLLQGTHATIRSDYLSNTKHRTLPEDVLLSLAGCRMLTSSEIELDKGKINTHVLKVISGNDIHHHPNFKGLKIKSSCSALLSTNTPVDENANPEWTSTAIFRRVVVINTRVSALSLPQATAPGDPADLVGFLATCGIYCRNHSVMPVSGRSVLATIFPSATLRLDTVLAFGEGIPYPVCYSTTKAIAREFRMEPADLVRHASLISPYAVLTGSFGPCLRGIGPRLF